MKRIHEREKCTMDKLIVAYRHKAEFYDKESRYSEPPRSYAMHTMASACREVVEVLRALADKDTRFINDQIKCWDE